MLTQGPGRPAAVGGTLVALATVVVGVVLGTAAVGMGVSNALAVLEARPVGLPPVAELLEAVGAGLLVLGMWTTAGVLLGSLARSPALAVGLRLVWALVVESLLRSVSGPARGAAPLDVHLVLLGGGGGTWDVAVGRRPAGDPDQVEEIVLVVDVVDFCRLVAARARPDEPELRVTGAVSRLDDVLASAAALALD